MEENKSIMRSKEVKPTVCFFTYVNKKYYYFVLPFIFSILKNTEHSVHVVVEDTQTFHDKFGKKLSNLLYSLCSKGLTNVQYKITDLQSYQKISSKIIPNTIRFLLTPLYYYWHGPKYDYTYITDCDMLITAEDAEKAIKHNIFCMKKKYPFFNIKRPDRKALSGVHFVKTSLYYYHLEKYLKNNSSMLGDDFAKFVNGVSDEGFLYDVVNSCFGDPEKLTKGNERILPGMHLSPNRDKSYLAIKEELCKDELWKEAFKQFGDSFIQLMS